MKLIFKKLNEKAVIPARSTPGSAGLDLCACLDAPVTIAPGERQVIPTGLSAMTDESSVAMLVYPRSGLSAVHGVTLANCVGVIDSDYRGEWLVPLINHGSDPFIVENGMRIAQVIPTRVIIPEIETADELSETERGAGGFGSSGLE